MLKFIEIALFVLITLMSPQSQAMTLNLAPQESKTIANHYMWTLNATCTIKANASAKRIRIHVVKNNGTVNGKTLKSGQTTSVMLNDKDNLAVSADAGAEVNLQNLSQEMIEASCSV